GERARHRAEDRGRRYARGRSPDGGTADAARGPRRRAEGAACGPHAARADERRRSARRPHRAGAKFLMRAVLCTSLDGPSALSFGETPSPTLGPRQVRIAVKAAGLNFADTLIVQGKYQVKPALPFVPGLE